MNRVFGYPKMLISKSERELVFINKPKIKNSYIYLTYLVILSIKSLVLKVRFGFVITLELQKISSKK